MVEHKRLSSNAAVIMIAVAAAFFIGIIALVTYILSASPTPHQKLTYEARCHDAMLNDSEYPAYAILKAEADNCQVILPEGGTPLLNSWFECRYTGEKVFPCIASSTIPWPAQSYPRHCILGRQEWEACTAEERTQWKMWIPQGNPTD